jgi:hypothetical protein
MGNNVWNKAYINIILLFYHSVFHFFPQKIPCPFFKIMSPKKTPFRRSQQPQNCENRNDPDLVQAFLKKWWVESDFKAPNLPLSLRLKGSGCHYSIYNNTALCKIVRSSVILLLPLFG